MTAETMEGSPDEVLFEQRGHLGVITLNRPKAVNALNAGMVAAMLERLAAWADDDGVATVLVQGSADVGHESDGGFRHPGPGPLGDDAHGTVGGDAHAAAQDQPVHERHIRLGVAGNE